MVYDQRNWAQINIDNIKHNLAQIKKTLQKNTKILAVVKADGYGCGSVQCARALLEEGADMLAVAFTDEGEVLRKAGINSDILVLGNTDEKDIKKLFDYNITPTIYERTFAEKLSDYAKEIKKEIKVHIKLDTGMGRIGFLSGYGCDDISVEEILYISKLPMIKIEGIFTHFALADEENRDYTHLQFDRFNNMVKALENKGLDIEIKHCANSATTMMYEETHLDMVRPGIILYGYYPSAYLEGKKIDLKPVMEFKTKIINIKEVEKGTAISYGCTFVTERKSKIATIPVGYADGLSRGLSGKYSVLVDGKYAPIVGKICMDQCMIDVTDVNNIHIGDEVVIFGEQKGIKNPIEKMAEMLETINYEIICDIGKRVPRVYLENDKVAEIHNLLF